MFLTLLVLFNHYIPYICIYIMLSLIIDITNIHLVQLSSLAHFPWSISLWLFHWPTQPRPKKRILTKEKSIFGLKGCVAQWNPPGRPTRRGKVIGNQEWGVKWRIAQIHSPRSADLFVRSSLGFDEESSVRDWKDVAELFTPLYYTRHLDDRCRGWNSAFPF